VDAGEVARCVLARQTSEEAPRADAISTAVRAARLKALRTWKETRSAERAGQTR